MEQELRSGNLGRLSVRVEPATTEDELQAALTRLCSKMKLSEKKMMLESLLFYEQKMFQESNEDFNTPTARIPNGIHRFEIRSCTPGKFVSNLILRRIKRDRPIDLNINNNALHAIANTISSRWDRDTINTAELVSHYIDIVVRNDTLTKLPNGTPLSL